MPCLIVRNGIYHAIFHHHEKQVWRSTYSRDRESALQVMAELQKEFVSWKRMTILKLRDQIVTLMRGQNSKGTIDLYDLSLRQFANVVGDKCLKAVTPYDIEVFKSKRLQEVNPASVSMNLRTLKTAFNMAVRFRMIQTNPFREVKNVVIPQKEPVFLSQNDIKVLLQATPDAQLRAIIVFAICTSMRARRDYELKMGRECGS